jgi:hypothetical protein
MNAVYLDLSVRSVLRWGKLYPQEFLHRITVIYIKIYVFSIAIFLVENNRKAIPCDGAATPAEYRASYLAT